MKKKMTSNETGGPSYTEAKFSKGIMVMNKETILKKSIEKAVKGGYNNKLAKIISSNCDYYEDGELDAMRIEFIIFDHDFCKAFWGEEGDYYGQGEEWMEAWEYHISELALSEDRLEYIKRFL